MSPFEQGRECYSLCWEGVIGKFHHIDKNLNITAMPTVLNSPGMFYGAPYFFALPGSFEDKFVMLKEYKSWPRKLMALTGFAKPTKELEYKYKPIIEEILSHDMYDGYDERFMNALIKAFANSGIHGIGIQSQEFKDFMYYMSEGIYNRFLNFAKNLKKGLPLLISGGCGLNCNWNSNLKNSGIFSDVFIPPVTNDSVQAIGKAIEAQYYYTGNAKINWSPYTGEEFIYDVGVDMEMCDNSFVAHLLARGKVLAWVQDKYEIGPRALCNRSLIAAPFKSEMHSRLNKIKQRESYRPIAPVVIEEDVNKYFDWDEESPYMLHFAKVKSEELCAITHVDETARLQTVNPVQNSKMYTLLKEFEKQTGFPILCNTSLNFKGRGFINKMSDLLRYVKENDIDGFVVNGKIYLKKET